VLSSEEIRRRLDERTYRPGWSWTLKEDPWEGRYVRFLCTGVADAFTPGATIDIGFDSWLPPMESIRQLDLWMQWRLARAESHESREFYQLNGNPLFDPHSG
jgi:hypothetical protein